MTLQDTSHYHRSTDFPTFPKFANLHVDAWMICRPTGTRQDDLYATVGGVQYPRRPVTLDINGTQLPIDILLTARHYTGDFDTIGRRIKVQAILVWTSNGMCVSHVVVENDFGEKVALVVRPTS